MKTITNISQLIKNLETLENCLVSGEDKLFKEAISLVKHGICFVAYNINNETRFAPSRFVGYIDNEIEIHLKSPKHGNTTNKAIIDILKSEPHSEKNLESKYIQYCHSLGIKPNKTGALGNERRYWNISLETNS